MPDGLDHAVRLELGVHALGHVAAGEDLLHVGGVGGKLARGGEKTHVGVGDDDGVSQHGRGAPRELRQVVGGEEGLEHLLAPDLEDGRAGGKVQEGGAEVPVGVGMAHHHGVRRTREALGEPSLGVDEKNLPLAGLDVLLQVALEAAQAQELCLRRDVLLVLGHGDDVLVQELVSADAERRAAQLVKDGPQLHVKSPQASFGTIITRAFLLLARGGGPALVRHTTTARADAGKFVIQSNDLLAPKTDTSP